MIFQQLCNQGVPKASLCNSKAVCVFVLYYHRKSQEDSVFLTVATDIV